MRLIIVLLSLFLVCPAAYGGALREIEARLTRGEIDLGTFHRLRATAVMYPSRLPAELRAMGISNLPRSGTPILAEAFQWLSRRGEFQDPLHEILAPPADLEHSLDSTRIPLRVLFDAADTEVAGQVLEASEQSWALQVDSWGWWPPLFEPALGPYRVYIGATGSGVAGYTSPYASNPQTPHADCFTFVVINPGLGSFTPATVAHELNHAMQAAMDCSEVITYWENTAVYMEVATFPHLAMQALWSFYSFQALPWRSLDYFEYGQGYQYGGSLWNFFLVDAYDAPDTGPVMLRQIWEASMQEGESNSVTYFDGIAQVLSERTAEASPLEAAFVDFCEARYFVGERDDGAHIDGARDWWFGELIITDRHTVFDLPIERGAPVDARRPAPFGSNHIQLDLPQGYSAPIRIRFRGELMNRWAARVLLLSTGPVEAVDLEVDSETGMGEAVVPTEGMTALLLVVANLGPAGFQPGVGRRDGGVYTYDLLPELPPPVIVGADPPTLAAGQQGVLMRLLGEGFVLGQDFRVSFEDPTIQVDSVIAVSSDEVVLRLTIPAMTSLGPKSVLVTNHGGQSARGVDVVTILAPPTRETEGCACQAPVGQDPAGATPVVLACFLAFALGRRLRGRRR